MTISSFDVRHIYFRYNATSGSITFDAIEQPDPNNMGKAVGILILAIIELEIWSL